jgi:Protein of unknown function (DUF2442)
MEKLAKIIKVESHSDFTLSVWFSDGLHGLWHEDMDACQGPMAAPLHDPSFFARATIEDGAVVWPNGWDACADYVQEEMRRAGTLVSPRAAAK